MYHNFLILSSTGGHLGYFHVLAIAHSAAMNIGIDVSLPILISLLYMPSSGIAWWGVVWQFYYQFFKESPHCSPQ